MRRYLAILFLLATATFAQNRVPFEFFTYVPPSGWNESKDANGRIFTKEVGTKFALLTLMKPLPSNKSSRENFDVVWETVMVEQLGSKVQPTMGKAGPKDGWMGEVGYAPFENATLKGVALMTTLTGNGKVVTVFALTNAEDLIPEIETFVDNISLPPIASAPPAISSAPAASEDAAKLIGKWQRSSSGIPAYADPASWGTAGYTKSRYEFRPDGTYSFTERSFRYTYQNIIIVRENGKYSVSGETLTISPVKSTITAYAKAGGGDALGSVVKTQSRSLEKVDYRFKFHYFSGIQEWNLVLMADQPTQRDGPFSNNKSYNNAWYYDQKYVDTDLTAARQ